MQRTCLNHPPRHLPPQVGHQVQSGVRPYLPDDRSQLPGQPAPGVEEYIALVKRCWAMDATSRPSFDRVIQVRGGGVLH